MAKAEKNGRFRINNQTTLYLNRLISLSSKHICLFKIKKKYVWICRKFKVNTSSAVSNAQYIIFQLLKKTNKTTDVITGKVMIINFDVSILQSFFHIYNILQCLYISTHCIIYKYDSIKMGTFGLIYILQILFLWMKIDIRNKIKT